MALAGTPRGHRVGLPCRPEVSWGHGLTLFSAIGRNSKPGLV